MHPFLDRNLTLNRRQFFGSTGIRLGGVAMGMCAATSLLAREDADPARMYPPLPGLPHFAAKAQNDIKIGFVTTFSGAMAVVGNDMRDAFELALVIWAARWQAGTS